MTRRGRPRRPDGNPSDPVRSVRISNADWEKGKKRATYEGHTPSHVVNLLWKGYADGMINLPRIQVVYSPPPAFAGEPEQDDAAETVRAS